MEKTYVRLIPDEPAENSLSNVLKNDELKAVSLQEKIETIVKWCQESPKNVVYVHRLLKGRMLQPGIVSFQMTRYLHIDWLKCSFNNKKIVAQTQVELIQENRALIPDESYLENPSSFFSQIMWENDYFRLDVDYPKAESSRKPLLPAMDLPLAVKVRAIDENKNPSVVSEEVHIPSIFEREAGLRKIQQEEIDFPKRNASISGSTSQRPHPSFGSCRASTASLLETHTPASRPARRISVHKLNFFSPATMAANMKEATDNRKAQAKIHALDFGVIAALKVRIHRARKKRMRRRRFIVRPFTFPKMIYDTLMALLVCYSVITVPVQLSFQGMNADGFKGFNMLTDVFFLLDMAICFCTAYEEGGQLVYDRKLIAKHYLKTLFFPDLLGSFPFYILAAVIGISSNLFIFKLMRLLRAMRLVRFTLVSKFSRIARLIKKLKTSGFDLPFQSDSTFMNLISRTIKILFIAHLMACTWHSLNSCKHESYDWVRCGNDTNLASQYLASFYFTIQTMMTVGYGDIAVNTDAQRAFAMVIQLTGPLIVGVIVSSIGELVESFDLRSKYMAERMSSLKEYMDEKDLPAYVCRKLVNHFNYFYNNTTVFKEGAIIESLPPPVLEKLVLHQHKINADNIIFFKCSSFCGHTDFLMTVFRHLKPMFTQAGHDIAIQGDPAEDIYFLKKGQLDGLLINSGVRPIVVGVYRQGSTVNMANVVLRLEMPFTLRAACQSDILWIHMQDWKAAMAKHPKAELSIMGMVEKERENMRTVLQSATKVLGNFNTKEFIFCEPNLGNVQRLWKAEDVEVKVKHLEIVAGFSRRTIRTIRLTKSMLRWATGFDLLNRKKISPENLAQFDHDVIEKEETTRSLWKQYLIDPQCDAHKYWSLWIVLLTLYSVIVIPFSIGFDFSTPILSILDGVVDVFFLLDILKKFRTLDEAGPDLYFADPVVIALRYLRSWFVLDLLSSLPLESISFLGTHHKSSKGQFFRLVRVCRVLRWLKLMRLFKFAKLSKTVKAELGAYRYIINQLIILFGSLLYVGHFFGCFWAFVAYENQDGLEGSWMAPLSAGPLSLVEADIANKYTASVYWAFTTITTVGYGDIKPTNDYEKLYSVIIMVIGAALFSFIVGNVSNLAYQLSILKQVQKKKVSEINEYVKEQRLGYNLSNSIKKHVKFAFSQQTSQVESEILKLIPCELRKEILLYSHQSTVDSIPMFADAPRSFVATCLQKMASHFYEARAWIYNPHEGSKGVYFVIKGVVEELKKHPHTNAKEKLIGIVEKGGYFGHRKYVNGVKVSFGAKAVADSHIFVLFTTDFAQLEIEFPSVAKTIKTWVHNAHAGVLQSHHGKEMRLSSFNFGRVKIQQVAPSKQ